MSKATATLPDCANCIHRETCPRFKVGNFCTAWASKSPAHRSEPADPNTAWRTAQDYEE